MTKREWARISILAIMAALGSAVALPSAEAGPTIYVAGTGNEFGTLDLATGAFTPITTLALPVGDLMYGMGFGADGKLYGLDSEPDSHLWQINTSDGSLTDLGAIGQSVVDATTDASGKLYALSQDVDATYFTMNPPSTATNVVGLTGLSSLGLMAVTADGSHLYTTIVDSVSGTNDLVSINPTSGAATTIGDTGFTIDNGLFVGGTLYGFDTNNAIVTIDTSTGLGTQLGTYDLPNGDFIVASAFGPQSVPEPSSLILGLVATALAGTFGLIRHRRQAGEPD